MRLSAPTIELSHAVIPVRAVNNVLEPPAGVLGWWPGSPTPGQPGVSVLLGHVTYNGPDVFWRLNELRPGQTVTIRHANGGASRWVVSSAYSINKDRLPGVLYAKGGAPRVALVTCDKNSPWQSNGRHHTDNYVVMLTQA